MLKKKSGVLVPFFVALVFVGCGWAGGEEVEILPPSAPKNVQIFVGDGIVTMNWVAPETEVDIWYELFLDGELKGKTENLEFVFDGLESDIEYKFEIRTVNAGGHSVKVAKYATLTNSKKMTEQFVFSVHGDGYSVTITKHAGVSVIIPSEHNGKPVTKIVSIEEHVQNIFVPCSVVFVKDWGSVKRVYYGGFLGTLGITQSFGDGAFGFACEQEFKDTYGG
jgi:hypothetical protein